MIVHLLGLISQAENEIGQTKIMILEAEKELNNCKELKTILLRLIETSSNVYNQLQRVGYKLNEALIINEKGQGNSILDRSLEVDKLVKKADIGEKSVQLRIKELEENINNYKIKINNLNNSISGWRTEIARLEEIARQIEESAKNTITNG